MSQVPATDHTASPLTWRERALRLRDRMPPKLRRALTSKKTLALFLIALLGKLAFYGVLAWQLVARH
jgi:hypothetical protein